jgi:D-glycero-alpha-D-manno-heptose-7-phosphate kinase
MMRKITAEAPMRVDFAGGTIDIPPLFLFHKPAMTVNAAISVKARVIIQESNTFSVISEDQGIRAEWSRSDDIVWREYPKLELILRLIRSFEPKENYTVTVQSDAPQGSGLGASSAIAIALTAALARWHGREFSDAELVEYAKSIETQTIKVPTGYQDYWAAVYGGVRAYHMGLDGKVDAASLGSKKFHAELEHYLMLAYVGVPHFSGANNWELFKSHIDGDAKTIHFFEALKENAILMKDAFVSEKIEKVADALNQDWKTRKQVLSTMTTPEIEWLMKEAFANGAKAGRVCGAGAGGCVLLLIDPAKRDGIEKIVQKLRMRVLPFSIAHHGVYIASE